MRAVITELWNTGRDIIDVPEGEFDENWDGYQDDRIESFSDLKKCENVLVDKPVKGEPFRTIILNDTVLNVTFRNVNHPTGCGKIRICEIV